MLRHDQPGCGSSAVLARLLQWVVIYRSERVFQAHQAKAAVFEASKNRFG